MGQHSFSRTLGVIALAAFALRFALRAWRGANGFWTDGYTIFASLAQSMAAGDGYALPNGEITAFRVPFYPLFLLVTGGGNGQFWTVLVAQALASTGTVVLTGLIARRLFSPVTGLLAALLAACWPYAAWHDTALQESGLFAFLTALATWMLLQLRDRPTWWRAVATGLVLGMAILTRATLLPFALAALLWLALPSAMPSPVAKRLLAALLAGAGMLLALAPWLAYSAQVLGSPALGAEAGRALYAGNHALTFRYYPEASIDESRRLIFATQPLAERQQLRDLDPLAREDWYREQAVDDIRAHPARTVRYAAAKLVATFGPLPSPRKGGVADWLYALGWTPLFLLGLAGMWQSRANWRRDALFYALIGTFAAITALIWGHTSHRSYLDYYFIIFAAFAILRIFESPLGRSVLARLPHPVRRALANKAGDSGA